MITKYIRPIGNIVGFAAVLAFSSSACSQTAGVAGAPPQATPSAPVSNASSSSAPPAVSDALSAEDQNASPFPAGRHAAVVKRVCTECHNAFPIIDLRYTKEDATRYYRTMVSSDTTTEDAQKIIEYLSTTLGR